MPEVCHCAGGHDRTGDGPLEPGMLCPVCGGVVDDPILRARPDEVTASACFPAARGGAVDLATTPAQRLPAGNSPTLEERSASAGHEPAVGKDAPLLPGYEILGELGRGGMGVVYKARHRVLNRMVAIKMILAGGHGSGNALARFQAEARAVARLQHPNIVQIFEVGEHDRHPFFSLEYVEGGSLAQRLEMGLPPPVQAAQLLEVLARAVHFAHERGIVHRDLKPGNVLLGGDARVPLGQCVPKITDFGIAKELNAGPGHTETGAILGTPNYMAPEQARGRSRDIGPPTDVWALGAILYELLTGRPPFIGLSAMDVILKMTAEEPVPPSRLQPRLPRDLETICLKCLQKDPRGRYPSALALAEDLARFSAHEPIRARPVGLAGRVVRWARRRPAAAGLLVLTTAVVSALGGVAIYNGRVARRDLEAARVAVEDLIRQGQEAEWKGDPISARGSLEEAIHAAAGKPGLEDLAAEAQKLLDPVKGRLEIQRRRLQAQQLYQKFLDLRSKALFHAALSGGEAAAANLAATQDAARAALKLVGEDLRADDFTPAEREEILRGKYELLLVLAEAAAQPRPGQAVATPAMAQEALELLHQAAALGLPPQQAYHLRRARYLKLAGEADEAEKELRRAAARPPASAFDNYLVGVDRYRQGAPEAAAASFVQALFLQPKDFWPRYFLALCYVRLGRLEAARDGLTACLAQKPDEVWIYLLRGFVQGQLGLRNNDPKSLEDAETDFSRALELLAKEPKNIEARYALYNNRAVLRVGQKRYAEAVADLEKAIELRPNQYQAYASLAQAYVQQKQVGEAVKAFDGAVAAAESLMVAGDLDVGTLALLLRNRARLQLERKDPAAAVKDLRRAAGLEPAGSPGRGLACEELGYALTLLGRSEEALKAFNDSLAARPQNADTLRRRAELLFRMKRWAEAADGFGQYLRCGGKPTARIYSLRGLARSRASNGEGALEDFTAALEMDPDNSDLRMQRGQAYLACRAWELALHDFDGVLRHDPSQAAAYLGRAEARVRLDQVAAAVADAEEAVRRGPVTPRLAHAAASVCALAAGKVAQTNPADIRCYRYRGRAVRFLRQALQQLPAPAERRKFWREQIAPDDTLRSLRDSEDFQRLQQEYAAGGAARRAAPLQEESA